MPTSPTEAASHTKLALLVMAGLPSIANTTTNPPTLKGELITFLCKMKSESYSDDTIERYGRALETSAKRGADF